ncbi:MAG: DUF2442 domain-containing protein [Candidatus Omnitrophica bacterium]|nr:DUF2442 domain-containing protein [Candidatus Omnitrophota bacterium]
MEKVTQLKVLDGYRLEVSFEDGLHGVVTLSDRLFGPVFEPLKDESIFAQARIDDFGVVTWPNGADLAPDALYESFQASKVN